MSKETQKSAPEGERIAKYLARAGVASRREVERMIEAGRITLNGKVLDTPAVKVTDADEIIIDNKPAPKKDPPRVWRYYKPVGLVTSESDEKGRDTVFDKLPENMPRVLSVGRLDLNSEGLLLLTNDGGFKRTLELPSTGWLRKYRVRVNGSPVESMLEPLRQGIVVDGEKFQPMTVTMDRQQGANAWLTVGIREGKNREIRRAMEAVGLTVNRLIRVSYGPFQLGDLKPGEVAPIPPKVFWDQLSDAQKAEHADSEPAEPLAPKAKRPVPRGGPGGKPGGKPGVKPTPGRKPGGKPGKSAGPKARPISRTRRSK